MTPPDLRRYLDARGRISVWPGRKRRAEREALLDLLAPLIPPGVRVPEPDVNELIAARITVLDHAYFRRELVDTGRWGRTDDGDAYWREERPEPAPADVEPTGPQGS